MFFSLFFIKNEYIFIPHKLSSISRNLLALLQEKLYKSKL